LTAYDVVALLDAQRFHGKATILSRRGLLPRPHIATDHPGTPLSPSAVEAAPRTLRGLLRWGRTVVRGAAARGEPWQVAIDSTRPHLTRLWRGLSPRDRARFVRTVRPYWEVLRHRAPQDAHELVHAWLDSGKLEFMGGSVASCKPTAEGLVVTLRRIGGATQVD